LPDLSDIHINHFIVKEREKGKGTGMMIGCTNKMDGKGRKEGRKEIKV
jgi:hypothetical protein